jgi:hypothetical protein
LVRRVGAEDYSQLSFTTLRVKGKLNAKLLYNPIKTNEVNNEVEEEERMIATCQDHLFCAGVIAVNAGERYGDGKVPGVKLLPDG